MTALANDLPNRRLPGYLVIGVKDDGTPSGLKVTAQLLQSLGGLKYDGNIQPLPSLNVAKFTLPGRKIGPRMGIANQQEEKILTENASPARAPLMPCRGLAVP